MDPVEALADQVQVALAQSRPVTRNGHVGPVVLSEVAGLDDGLDHRRAGEAFRGDLLERAGSEALNDLVHLVELQLIGAHARGLRLVDAHVGDRHAERREDALVNRDEHLFDPDDLRERRRVQRAGAPERDEGELARIQAAVDRDEADRVDHIEIDQVDDRLSGLEYGHVQATRESLERRFRGGHVERHLATQEVARVEAAEDQVRVGHGRLGAAAAVANRTGSGAGALRAHPKQPTFVDPGDRSTAGADRPHVDHRRVDRQPPLHLVLGRPICRAVRDQADVEARSAHVDGDEVFAARQPAEMDGAEHAADRTGHQQIDRLILRGLVVFDPAV